MTCVCTPTQQVQVMDAKVSNIELASKQAADATRAQTTSFLPKLDTIAWRMCSWAAPEYGVAGETADRTAQLLAQVAIYSSLIALNTYIQNQNYKIARAYADLAKDKWDRFKNGYVPLETKLISEASNTPEPTADYAGAKTRAVNATTFAFNSAKQALANYAKMYALCMDNTLDMSRAQALMRDDTINFNYRDAEKFKEYESDKRWNRRSDILNLGRNNHATAFSYAQHASEAFAGFANAVQGIGNGISGLMGYMFNRNETIYPQQFSQASIFGNGAIVAAPSLRTRV